MNTKMLEKLSFRWSLLNLLLASICIGLAQLISGGVEPSNSLRVTENWIVNLPFSISIWWYLALVPIITTSIIWVRFSTADTFIESDKKIYMNVGLFAGIALSLILNVVEQYGFALLIGISILLSTIISLMLKDEDLHFVIIFGFFFGMGSFLVNGILAGLISTSIIVVVGFIAAVFGRGALILIQDLSITRVGFKNWILAKDIESDKEEV